LTEENKSVPWICHVCGKKSATGAGKACSLCFKIACDDHLKPLPLKSEQFGNLELKLVCAACSETLEGEDGKSEN
jgi:hypothetical protein